VNLHPGKQEYIPPDYDGVIDRKNDIMYHDRTRFDEYVAVVMADLQVLSKSLIKIAEGNSQYKEKIQKLLLKRSKSFTLETIVVAAVLGFGGTIIIMKVINSLIGLRVNEGEELIGLDTT
jgi:hypothetical protein